MNASVSLLSETITPLSLQAGAWSYASNPYNIRQEGCEINGIHNCTQACTSVASIFSSGATFANCLAYPLISKLGSSSTIAQDYGYITNNVNISRYVVGNMTTCLRGYVDSLPACNGNSCNGTDLDLDACKRALQQSAVSGVFPLSNSSDPLQGDTFACVNAICSFTASNAKVSGDIGGIGVYISYLMQISILLSCWLGLEYFRFGHLPLKSWRGMGTRSSTQKEMFIEATIEFHRAQCYFMSAILLAAIVATQNGGLDTSSLQQEFNNLALLAILSVGGSLPTMFMLFKLRIMGHRSWYTFILSSVTLFLALALQFSSGKHKKISLDLLDPPDVSYVGCGPVNPTSLCLSGYDDWAPGYGTTEGTTSALFDKNNTSGIVAIVISLVLWIILLVDEIREFGVEMGVSTMKKYFKWPTSKKFWFAFGVFDFIVCVGTLTILIYYLKSLVTFGYGPPEWSFGQIVALVVWIPPFVQYVYLQFNGVQGSRWSLPNTLEVVRVDQGSMVSQAEPVEVRDEKF